MCVAGRLTAQTAGDTSQRPTDRQITTRDQASTAGTLKQHRQTIGISRVDRARATHREAAAELIATSQVHRGTAAGRQHRGPTDRDIRCSSLSDHASRAAQLQAVGCDRAVQVHVATGIDNEIAVSVDTAHIQVALRAQVQVGGIQHARRRQTQVLRSAYAEGALITGLRMDHHLVGSRDLQVHIAGRCLGIDLIGIDLEHGASRTNTLGSFDVEHTQVHIDRHRRCGRHGQAARCQAQAVQIEVQVREAGRLAQNEIALWASRNRQTTLFAVLLRCLEQQALYASPAHGVVLAGKQAIEETHRGVA